MKTGDKMNFYEQIKKLSADNNLIIFVDMDGVVACYDIGKPYDYLEKRPLFSNIEVIKKINDLSNVEIYILSVCKKEKDIIDKNKWLDKYMSFIKNDKRIIINKEKNDNLAARFLKLNYLKSLKTTKKIVLIDDDNEVLKTIMKNMNDVILFQDSELVD